jgi:hypothetical protein
MYFQTLDDKSECVGVYKDGRLHFEDIPTGLLRTWRPGGFVHDDGIEYAWLMSSGKTLLEACPPNLIEEYQASIRKMTAFYKSFKIARLNFDDHCIFDLIPHDSLIQFCEIKNKITQHVFETCEKPENYDFMVKVATLIHKIRYQPLNIDMSDCKGLHTSTSNRASIKKIMQLQKYIDYNIYGTVTGRLTTNSESFPVLTMKKELRKILKPQNDWFVSLDYNGAEARTVLSLLGNDQPDVDIHEWNIKNIFHSHRFNSSPSREEAKIMFFGWLYDPTSSAIKSRYYDRDGLLKDHYKEGCVKTVFGRSIQVEQRKALNYLIQSTTSDLVLEQAIEIDNFLKDKKSFISHIVHDELVIDMADDERDLVPDIKDIFANNRLDRFMVNLQAGQNYYDLKDLKV